MIEPPIMAILAKFIKVGFRNARRVMNIDMVNPMPPSRPAPKICFI